jgi:hypothetical protein
MKYFIVLMLNLIKDLFDKIYVTYDKINIISKDDIISKLPDYLKTDIKKTYLDKLQYLNVLKHIYNKKDSNISYKKFIEKSMLNVNDLDFDNFTNIDFDRIYLIHLKNLLKELSETNRSERLKTINIS